MAKKPPADLHLCSWCNRVVSLVDLKTGDVLKEMPLSETPYTVQDFQQPGGSHGICTVCREEQLRLLREMKRKGADKVEGNPPPWAVDRKKWRQAVDLARQTYRMNPRRRKIVPGEFYAVVAHIYKQLGGRIKRKARGNPTRSEWDAILSLYADWQGRPASMVDKLTGARLEMPAVVARLGDLVAVEYRSDKFDGRSRVYRHKFGKDKPVLVADHTGQLWIIGGAYKITADGIEG